MKTSAEFIRMALVALIAAALLASCQTRHKGCDAYDKLHQVKKAEGQTSRVYHHSSEQTR